MKKDKGLLPVVVPSRGVKKSRRAVSPVVGVMLMLIVTVIIAAAVHSYASSLATTTSKAPSGTWDVKIKNSGYWKDSGIWLTYLSGDPVPSKDIKIVMIHKNNITEAIPNTVNVHYNFTKEDNTTTGWTNYSGPIAYVNDTWKGSGTPPYDVQFGNYTIETGVMLKASPVGWDKVPGENDTYNEYGYGVLELYKYSGYNETLGLTPETVIDPVRALLKDWEYVRPGDTVTVEIVHIPSGKTIYKADIVVEG